MAYNNINNESRELHSTQTTHTRPSHACSYTCLPPTHTYTHVHISTSASTFTSACAYLHAVIRLISILDDPDESRGATEAEIADLPSFKYEKNLFNEEEPQCVICR